MADGEVIESDKLHKVSPPDSFGSVIWDGIASIKYFIIVVAFIVYVLLSSTTFNSTVLSLGDGYLDSNGEKTDKGVIVTGILLGILIGLFDTLHDNDYI